MSPRAPSRHAGGAEVRRVPRQGVPCFGGQKANEIFADSAANVADDWSYLPFQAYANSIFNDTVGKAYISGTRLEDGLKAWQDASVKYGEEQGFTVEK